MTLVACLKTTDELFQFGGDGLPPSVTGATYAIMFPDAAEQMLGPFGEAENFSDHIDLGSPAGSQNPVAPIFTRESPCRRMRTLFLCSHMGNFRPNAMNCISNWRIDLSTSLNLSVT